MDAAVPPLMPARFASWPGLAAPEPKSTRHRADGCYFFVVETTVQLDDKLLAEAKHYARQVQRSFSEVVAEALQEKMSRPVAGVSTRSAVPSNMTELHPDIRRVTGLASADLDAAAVYQKHLAGRHA